MLKLDVYFHTSERYKSIICLSARVQVWFKGVKQQLRNTALGGDTETPMGSPERIQE